jgi:abortive infection bacteriophage resistance protein
MGGRAKEFKTIDEQIEILKEKGLIIKDEQTAKDILLRENYFFISGYRYMFYKSDRDKVFIQGTTFEELYGLFQFDRNVRNIFFKHLLIIENNIKSIFSYQLSLKYGYKEADYLKLENFTQDTARTRQVSDVINKMKRQIRVNGRQNAATLHYLNNYGYLPMWIVVKVLSFGIISELYTILKNEDQRNISDFYKMSEIDMGIFLPLMSNYRNLCAHEDILYDHKTQRVIPNNKYHEKLNIPKEADEYKYGKNDMFALLIMLKYMLRDEEFRLLAYEIGYEIDLLDGKVNTIPLTKILEKLGFPANWKDIVEM